MKIKKLIDLKLTNLKELKENAVKKQKGYMKMSELYLQNVFGEDRYSNFLFKKKMEQDDDDGIGLKGWKFIQGFGMSKKNLRYYCLVNKCKRADRVEGRGASA